MAKRRLPRAVFDFFDGGAEDESTLRGNRAAFERLRLLPHVLVDVESVDARVRLLGAEARYPLAIAPTGVIGLGRRGADLALARAAKERGIPYTLATPATASIEEIAEQAGGRLWFQLYVLRDRAFRKRLVARAREAGYEALVVTVDLAVGGNRERDLANGFAPPFRANWRNLRDMWAKPAWVWEVLRHGLPEMPNLRGYPQTSTRAADVASSVGRQMDATFSWEDLKRLRDLWPRKLIVKGVERADDAERIAALGGDAVVVSNHGGRQLDGAAPTLEALPAVVRAAGGRLEVLLDGGVRRGVDILKARALGARAVLTGRATLFGAVAGGEAGARRALDILTVELERAMRLCGARSMDDVGPALIAPPEPEWRSR